MSAEYVAVVDDADLILVVAGYDAAEPVEVLSEHADVDVVVPGNTAFPCPPRKQRTPAQPVPYVVLPAYPVQDVHQLRQSELEYAVRPVRRGNRREQFDRRLVPIRLFEEIQLPQIRHRPDVKGVNCLLESIVLTRRVMPRIHLDEPGVLELMGLCLLHGVEPPHDQIVALPYLLGELCE